MNLNNLIHEVIKLQTEDNQNRKKPEAKDSSYGQGEESDE